ncbi:MAG: acyl-ACP--UDP-N-acetylglucosamine O-acyltransferase [Alphaproteobacteria bacterium]|nr:acyl-ACP--UDP-N-acetylglucosamine O-acyltransferase [Alphaproteobacteria bacterium]
MADNIHSTAVIEPGAEIDPSARIGPYCVVGPRVTLGADVVLKSHVVIDGRTSIGAGTIIHPFASIGGPPQDLKYAGEDTQLIIGKNNVIREHVTMNPGTQGGAMKTIVGDNGLFMMGAHVAHDCVIGDHVIMANNATLGGHVIVGDHVIIGGLAAVHQFVRIGDQAIIGGMSGVESDVIPYGRVKGERAFLAGLNLIGLERRGFNKDEIKNLQRAYNLLFGEEGTLEQRIELVGSDFQNDNAVMKMIEFARAKTRFPLCQPAKKAA